MAAAERLQFQAGCPQFGQMGFHPGEAGRVQLHGQGEQEGLPGAGLIRGTGEQLEEDPFMGGMLVDDEQAFRGLGQDVGALQLPQNGEFGKTPAGVGEIGAPGGRERRWAAGLGMIPTGSGGSSENRSAVLGSWTGRAGGDLPGGGELLAAGQLGGLQGLADRGQDQGVDPAAVFETHLGLGRVDVDIHLLGRGLQVHDKDRMAPPGQQSLIGLAHGPGQQPVADDAAVDQEELILGGGDVVIRAGDETGDPQSRSGQIQGQHLVGPFQPQEGGQPFPQAGVGRGLEQGLALGLDLEVDFRVAQGQMAQQLQDLALLRGLGCAEISGGPGYCKTGRRR